MDTNSLIGRTVAARTKRAFNSKADLATLRRGIGKKLGELPAILQYTVVNEELSKNEREKIEKAIYTALTLYALHQQGNAEFIACESSGINNSYRFGTVVGSIANGENDIAIKRRFDKALTAKNLEELATHARGLINLVKNAGRKLDYGDFAKDLYWFQREDYRRNVVLKWGRDFYMTKREED